MSVTEAQLNANRENAKHSTGATTPSGKKKVRMNAIKHGFSGHLVIVPAHEQKAYLERIEAFREEFNPKGASEETLARSLADLSWSTDQVRAQLHNLTCFLGAQPNELTVTDDVEILYAMTQAREIAKRIDDINRYSIYEQRKVRLFASTRKELVRIQAERKAQEKEELEEAAAIRRTTKAAHSAWLPAEDGFVCSLEIDRHIRRTDRLLPLRTAA